MLVVVEHGRRDAGEARGHLALLGGVAAAPGLGEHGPQGAEGARAGAVPVDERRRVGVERAHLRGRQRRQDRASARGQVGGQPDADVGDQRRAPRRALLDDVQHVATVQHGQVGGLARSRSTRSASSRRLIRCSGSWRL